MNVPTRVPEPFVIRVDDAVLEDLHRRLDNTRFCTDFANDDWRYGTNGDYLRELVEHWRTRYDWREQEREMMRFAHFRVRLDDVPIHFIHERGKGPNPVPIVISHGWPWTFWDMRHIIRPLTDPEAFGGRAEDSFDVIVPSLPGYGFSSPVTKPGINFWRTADMWHELMTQVLGYQRFAAHGGDWGSKVSLQLAHKYPADVLGVHVSTAYPLGSFSGERPWDFLQAVLVDTCVGEARAELLARDRVGASHMTVNMLDPQTLAYAMNDSPVGMLAWLLERRRAWSDCGGDVEKRFSKDDLITLAMIFWVTETFGTSIRYYREAAEFPWRPEHDRLPVVEPPTGISVMLHDVPKCLPRDWYRDYFNLHYLSELPSGGHFGAAEEPDDIVRDIRETFRELR